MKQDENAPKKVPTSVDEGNATKLLIRWPDKTFEEVTIWKSSTIRFLLDVNWDDPVEVKIVGDCIKNVLLRGIRFGHIQGFALTDRPRYMHPLNPRDQLDES